MSWITAQSPDPGDLPSRRSVCPETTGRRYQLQPSSTRSHPNLTPGRFQPATTTPTTRSIPRRNPWTIGVGALGDGSGEPGLGSAQLPGNWVDIFALGGEGLMINAATPTASTPTTRSRKLRQGEISQRALARWSGDTRSPRRWLPGRSPSQIPQSGSRCSRR